MDRQRLCTTSGHISPPPHDPSGKLSSLRAKCYLINMCSSRTVPWHIAGAQEKIRQREERMKASYRLSFYYQWQQFTNHPHFLLLPVG